MEAVINIVIRAAKDGYSPIYQGPYNNNKIEAQKEKKRNYVQNIIITVTTHWQRHPQAKQNKKRTLSLWKNLQERKSLSSVPG